MIKNNYRHTYYCQINNQNSDTKSNAECSISKVFERLIYNEFYEYLTANKLLTLKNSTFKKGDSTICQLSQNIYWSQ